MSASSPPARPPRFPNLRPEVVRGYLEAPEHMTAEVLDGELFVMSRPRPRHARAAFKLGGGLDGPFDAGRGGPGGWTFMVEPELHLGPKPDIVDPDIAGWRRERLPPEILDAGAPVGITIPPDWVCEILSEGTEAIDRGKKRRIYRREGVGHYWLLDPREMLLEFYRLEGRHWVEAGEFPANGPVRAEPFDAIELDLAPLWAP